MNKIFLLIFLILFIPNNLQSQNFTGYYVEFIERGKSNGSISTAEYLMDETTLVSFVLNKTDLDCLSSRSLTRFFNYSSFYFERIPKEYWPDGCHNQDCIDWNLKVSLHRSNYKTKDRIYLLSRKKNEVSEIALHIKKVALDVDTLGNIKDLREKNFKLQFFGGVGSGYIGSSSENNVLLRKIYTQKVLNELDIELLGLDKYLKLLDIKKANNDFHPHFTDYHLVKEKRKNAKFECFCDEYFPSNR